MVRSKIDTNATNLAYAEETSLKTLPVTPVWYTLDENSFSDFGADITKVKRSPIDPSRQAKKSVVVDLDASGGFNIDFTKSNLNRLLQGFFFADARELPNIKGLNNVNLNVSSVTAVTNMYTCSSALTGYGFSASQPQLLFASGFLNSANNGLKTINATAGSQITVNEACTAEAAPPTAANLQVVGYSFASGSCNFAVTSGVPSLTTGGDLTTFPGLIPGNWIFIGGDLTTQQFANNQGFARIKTVSATTLTFDDCTFTPSTESGTGKTIRIFVANVIRNEKTPSLIKRRSYNIERQLGSGATATQAEYLEGAVPNELTINIPLAEKLNVDMSFSACGYSLKSGEVGDTIKSGTRPALVSEDGINSASDVVRFKMAITDPVNSNPSSLFAYITEGKISIKNNLSPNKAIGLLGAFEMTPGDFEVSGEFTSYFSNTATIAAIRNNPDIGVSIISASKNAGFVFDIPLITLSEGKAAIEKDQPINLALTANAAENVNGYTMLYCYFAYLPNLAMPK